jgi:hypothetical protein
MNQAFEDEYNMITERYHRAINDLESVKRSVDGIVEGEGYTFPSKEFVDLVIHNTVRIDDNYTNIEQESPTEVVFSSSLGSIKVCALTGNVIATTRFIRDFPRFKEFEGKLIVYTREVGKITVRERERDILVPSRQQVILRRIGGKIKGFPFKSHHVIDNRLYEIDFRHEFGTRHVACIKTIVSKAEAAGDPKKEEKTVFFSKPVKENLFKYRGEWYEFREDEIFHVGSGEKTSLQLADSITTVHLSGNALFVTTYYNSCYVYFLE